MGEALLNNAAAGGIARMPELTMRSEDKTNDGGGGGGGGSPTTTTTTAVNNVVRWEKFLPKMSLRVLLVEADDCTRQIITALLRKCSYKVVSVSDGLKAWEVLKGKSQHIDLILTEVELPSISGFALLTLIMEHQVCKNIPVIMMSAHDSVSTVYKCMLRGAADFLVKPVRKNELKNLWQHVWRRQSSTAGVNGNQEESDTQPKVEATAENNATSNRSSGYIACIKQNRECIEKGSDAQSSCTKPDTEEQNDLTDSQQGLPIDDKVVASNQETNMAIDVRWVDTNLTNGNTSREAIDLIGSFDSYPKASYKSSLGNKIDHPSPLLDLSLRRCNQSGSVNQFSDDKHRLKQSDISAFSRYITRTPTQTPPPPPPTSGSASVSKKDCETNSENMIQVERVFSVPVPVRGVWTGHQEQSLFQPIPYYMSNLEARNEGIDLVMVDRNTTETMEDRGHLSSAATDHSTSSSFCNGGTLSRLNSIGSGSNGHSAHRSIQREAALQKFRMKRKDRCFDKKVRYESRKKLAEQRPRVKGQFVRQGQTSNPSPMES